MKLVFTPNGWQDYTYWLSADRATLERVNRLIDDVLEDPFTGIGKPEPLRHASPEPGPDASARSTGWSTSSTR